MRQGLQGHGGLSQHGAHAASPPAGGQQAPSKPPRSGPSAPDARPPVVPATTPLQQTRDLKEKNMTPAQAFPHPIDGLDPAAGLRRMEGDVDLYTTLLRDFIASEKDAARAIADALARDDRTAATRRAHTVKSLAGTFGAVRLQPAAQSLEAALRDGAAAGPVAERLACFEAALAALVDALEAGLPPEDATTSGAEPIDRALLEQLCRELTGLMANWDVSARRLLDSHAPLLRAAFPDDFTALQSALRDFDFDAASARLEAACTQAGITPGA